MQTVVEAARDEVPVPPREPQRQQGGMCDVEDGIRDGHLGGQRGARALGVDGLAGNHGERLEARGRIEAYGDAIGAYDEPPVQSGGGVVGVTLQLSRQLQQGGVELEEMVGGHQPGDDRRRRSIRGPRRGGWRSGCGR